MYTIVLTACIQPNPVSNIQRTNTIKRIEDYKSGLRFWLDKDQSSFVRGIIFIENTGYDLSELIDYTKSEDINPKNIACEFISLNCNHIPVGLHYGYAEFKLLDLGLSKSMQFACLKDSDMLIKATGRYTFPKIKRLLNSAPANYDIYADTKRGYIPGSGGVCGRSVLVGLLPMSKYGYNTWIRDAYLDMAPPPMEWTQFIEDVLYNRLYPLQNKRIVLRWRWACEPKGVGGNGEQLDSPKRSIKLWFKAILRFLMPWWWL